jgi:hypothetical protein
MFAAYFCHSCQSQVQYSCSLIKVDWLGFSSQGKPGLIPEIIDQTLLTNKKQENLD